MAEVDPTKTSFSVGASTQLQYAAPEVLLAHGVIVAPDPFEPLPSVKFSADVFSLSFSLLELLTGEAIYAGQTFDAKSASQVSEGGKRPQLPPADEQRYPLGFLTLVQDMWQRDPKARPTLPVVIKRLQTIRERLDMPNPPPEVPPTASPTQGRKGVRSSPPGRSPPPRASPSSAPHPHRNGSPNRSQSPPARPQTSATWSEFDTDPLACPPSTVCWLSDFPHMLPSLQPCHMTHKYKNRREQIEQRPKTVPFRPAPGPKKGESGNFHKLELIAPDPEKVAPPAERMATAKHKLAHLLPGIRVLRSSSPFNPLPPYEPESLEAKLTPQELMERARFKIAHIEPGWRSGGTSPLVRSFQYVPEPTTEVDPKVKMAAAKEKILHPLRAFKVSACEGLFDKPLPLAVGEPAMHMLPPSELMATAKAKIASVGQSLKIGVPKHANTGVKSVHMMNIPSRFALQKSNSSPALTVLSAPASAPAASVLPSKPSLIKPPPGKGSAKAAANVRVGSPVARPRTRH